MCVCTGTQVGYVCLCIEVANANLEKDERLRNINIGEKIANLNLESNHLVKEKKSFLETSQSNNGQYLD